MDKLFYIKIKNQDGTYSDQIPIGALAENVEWDSTHNLDDILGNVHTDTPIQTQIDNIQNTKVSRLDLNNYVEEKLDEDATAWLDQHYNDAEILKKGHLEYGEQQSTYSSVQPSNVETRQYPVTFDNKNKLSVNVPWTDTVFNPKLKRIWTATGRIMQGTLMPTLDNPEGLVPLEVGKTIAIYTGGGFPILRIYLNGTSYPVYLNTKPGTSSTWIKVEDADQTYLRETELGYTFFTYVTFGLSEPGFLRTSANGGESAIYTLQDEKADINSPAFTGEPTAPTPTAGSNNTKIATTAFVQNELTNTLKESHLKSTTKSELVSSSPSDTENRQYPVVFDKNGKLSVNVPWTQDEVASIVQKIWTGSMSGGVDTKEKIVTLDNSKDFSQPINGTTLILRTEGNNAKSEGGDQLRIKLQIEENETPIVFTHPIVYALTGNQQAVAMTDQLYCKWGPGIRVFTFRVDVNSPSGGYWILQDVSQQTIRQLASSISSKANLESPNFTGNPKTQTKDKTENSDVIASTKFVHDVVDQEINNTIVNLQDEIDSLQNNINNTISNLQTNINNIINELQTNIDDTIVNDLSVKIDSLAASFEDALPLKTQQIQYTNLASLAGNDNESSPQGSSFYWSSDGFNLITSKENYRNYAYSYRSTITNPYVQYVCSALEGLYGFKYKISFDPELPESIKKYPIEISIWDRDMGTEEYVKRYSFVSQKINEWISVSTKDFIEDFDSNIGRIYYRDPKIMFSIQKKNYNYSGNVIFEIKDFFIYHPIDKDSPIPYTDKQYKYFLKDILRQQNKSFKNGTITYPFIARTVDDDLSIQGAAADAYTVGYYITAKPVTLILDQSLGSRASFVRQGCYKVGQFVVFNFVLKLTANLIKQTPIFKTHVPYNIPKTTDIVMSNIAGAGSGTLVWEPNSEWITANEQLVEGTYYCSTIIFVEAYGS